MGGIPCDVEEFELEEEAALVGEVEEFELEEEATVIGDIEEFELEKETALMGQVKVNKTKLGNEKNTWIGDTGASNHICNSDVGMFDKRKAEFEEKVTVGKGEKLGVKAFGSLRFSFNDRGTKKSITLQNVAYIPNFCANLFAINKYLPKWNLGNRGKALTLTNSKTDTIIAFNRIFNSPGNRGGYVAGIQMETRNGESVSLAAIDLNDFHNRLGHCCKQHTLLTAQKIYGEGKFNDEKFAACDACNIGKSMKKKVNKVSEGKEKLKGGRLYIDISYVNQNSFGGRSYWIMAVDEATSYKWSFFVNTKDKLKYIILNLCMKLKN